MGRRVTAATNSTCSLCVCLQTENAEEGSVSRWSFQFMTFTFQFMRLGENKNRDTNWDTSLNHLLYLCGLVPPRPFQTTATCVRLVRLQVRRELPHSATPSTAVDRRQGRDDIYQAGLATRCDIYPRLCLTRAAPPRPFIGAAARVDEWDRKLHVYEMEGVKIVHHSAACGKSGWKP